MERTYPFELTQIESASSFFGWLDLGLDIKIHKKVKLVNIKCFEPYTEHGKRSKEFVEQLLKGKRLSLKVFKDKFHKWSTVLAVLYAENGTGAAINVNDLLISREMGTLSTERP